MKKYETIAVCAASAIIIFAAGFFAGKALSPAGESHVTVYEEPTGSVSLPLGDQTDDSKLDLNSADYDELCSLPGIGPELASKILAYRELNGGFEAVEELENIKGISHNIASELANWVSCK